MENKTMKTLIIYYSNYKGHTKMIAEAMAEVIGADLIKAEEFNYDISSYDLIGFGSGVYNQNQHPLIFESIEHLNLMNKNIFVFSTSSAGIDMYNKKIIDLLKSKGANFKGSFSCKGFYTNNFIKIIGGVSKGHPDNNDLTNAQDFVKKLNVESLQQ
jgi:flavodoxin